MTEYIMKDCGKYFKNYIHHATLKYVQINGWSTPMMSTITYNLLYMHSEIMREVQDNLIGYKI